MNLFSIVKVFSNQILTVQFPAPAPPPLPSPLQKKHGSVMKKTNFAILQNVVNLGLPTSLSFFFSTEGGYSHFFFWGGVSVQWGGFFLYTLPLLLSSSLRPHTGRSITRQATTQPLFFCTPQANQEMIIITVMMILCDLLDTGLGLFFFLQEREKKSGKLLCVQGSIMYFHS